MKKRIYLWTLTVIALLVGAAVYYSNSNNSGLSRNADEIVDSNKLEISGIITTIFTDCVGVTTLRNGEVIKNPIDVPVTCDGGSHIVLDETTTVSTTAGYTTAEYQFDKHNENWQVGDAVSGIVTKKENNGQISYSLDCDVCGLE